MLRPESVRRPAFDAPLRHPHYLSPRAEQRARFREEIAAFIDAQAAARARLSGRRIIPVVLS